MKWLREVLFGNWRNKGVAMFFAVTIWFVAYQSEKQEAVENLTVTFQPQDPERMVITSLRTPVSPQGGKGEVDFEGRIRVQLSGPRKLIAETKARFALGHSLPPFVVSPEDDPFRFEEEFEEREFDFASRGLTITSVSPPMVHITQEERTTRTIEDLGSPNRLIVTHRLDGHEIVTRRIVPDRVELDGPKSVLDSMDVRLSFSMELRESNEGEVEVVPVYGDETVPDFVRKNVKVSPRSVKVTVRTEEQIRTLSLDGVRIGFRLRMPGVPFNIVSDELDLVNGTIPVELYGPLEQIERIEELHRKNPLTLIAPVESIPPDQDSMRPFGEGDLEVPGFPEVRVRQHESRRGKGLWTYRILPVVGKDESNR